MANSLNSKSFPKVKVAAVQAEECFLDLDASVEKSCRLLEEAAERGAKLIVFPECYIAGYPQWYTYPIDRVRAGELDKEFYLNAVSLGDAAMEKLRSKCAEVHINAVFGINETEKNAIGSIHNCQVFVTADGEIAGKHQKLVPTPFTERLTQAPGHTGYANTFSTEFGTVSSLICGENSNPLAVWASLVNYPVVHAASWPSNFGMNSDMQNAIRLSTRAVAYTMKTFVVNSVSRISDGYIEKMGFDAASLEYIRKEREKKTGATIFGPFGEEIACGDGDSDELLVAELDLSRVIRPKMFQDFADHYNRPEVFAPLFEKYLR